MAREKRTQPLRIHINNSTAQPDVFHITRERFEHVLERFPDIGHAVETTIAFDGEGFDDAMRYADILVGFRIPTHGLVERAPSLKWIHLTGAGLEHLLPLDWVPKGVVLTTSSGAHAEKAADYAKMALLMLNNRMPLLMTSQRSHDWTRVFGTAIRDKTALVVGVGGMGSAAVKASKQLGLKVHGVRRSGRGHRGVDKMYRPDELNVALPHADFIVLTIPLTDETRHLVGSAQFATMKHGVAIINMARAGVMDYDALTEALEAGSVSGAILDVFDPEPLPPDLPLWDVPNLVITPHCSSDDAQAYAMNTVEILLKNVERYLAGRSLKNRVDIKLGY